MHPNDDARLGLTILTIATGARENAIAQTYWDIHHKLSAELEILANIMPAPLEQKECLRPQQHLLIYQSNQGVHLLKLLNRDFSMITQGGELAKAGILRPGQPLMYNSPQLLVGIML